MTINLFHNTTGSVDGDCAVREEKQLLKFKDIFLER